MGTCTATAEATASLSPHPEGGRAQPPGTLRSRRLRTHSVRGLLAQARPAEPSRGPSAGALGMNEGDRRHPQEDISSAQMLPVTGSSSLKHLSCGKFTILCSSKCFLSPLSLGHPYFHHGTHTGLQNRGVAPGDRLSDTHVLSEEGPTVVTGFRLTGSSVTQTLAEEGS